MYNKILVAVDLSDLSSTVFERALKLAELCDAKLTLLHVLSGEEEGYPTLATFPYEGFDPILAEDYLKRWRELEQQGLQKVQTFAGQARKQGIDAEAIQAPGNPGKIICETSCSLNIDLILMGNRGRSGFSELFLGSQSNYVMHHAPCSVWIIKLPFANSPSKTDLIKDSIKLTQA